MNMKLFTILDKVTGIYGDIFAAVNVAQAFRKFYYLMKNSPMVQADCSLYELGEYDTSTGSITLCDKPEFLTNYDEVK